MTFCRCSIAYSRQSHLCRLSPLLAPSDVLTLLATCSKRELDSALAPAMDRICAIFVGTHFHRTSTATQLLHPPSRTTPGARPPPFPALVRPQRGLLQSQLWCLRPAPAPFQTSRACRRARCRRPESAPRRASPPPRCGAPSEPGSNEASAERLPCLPPAALAPALAQPAVRDVDRRGGGRRRGPPARLHRLAGAAPASPRPGGLCSHQAIPLYPLHTATGNPSLSTAHCHWQSHSIHCTLPVAIPLCPLHTQPVAIPLYPARVPAGAPVHPPVVVHTRH